MVAAGQARVLGGLAVLAGGILAVLLWRTQRRRQKRQNDDKGGGERGASGGSAADAGGSEIVFLGTGSSSSTPRLMCLLDPQHRRGDGSRCTVCRRAAGNPLSRLNRLNPSLLVRFRRRDGAGGITQVIIDVGKTFYQSVVRHFPRPRAGERFTGVQAIVLSHDHADAVFGLDDVRSIQHPGDSTPVYLSKPCFASMQRVFPYLMPDSSSSAPEKVARKVSLLEWRRYTPFEPFDVEGFSITPLPVWHGEEAYACYGFLFGRTDRVLYLGDVSGVPPRTLEYIRSGGEVCLLIVDSLFRRRSHSTHMSWPQTREFIRVLRPRRALLTGLSDEWDDSCLRTRAELDAFEASESIRVDLAYDGLSIPLAL